LQTVTNKRKEDRQMILRGINDQTVEFKITNYQYPEINDGDWDGNWLLIYLKVKSDLGNWQSHDPSLTTWEVKELIGWLTDLANNEKLRCNPIEFTEPNLSFEYLETIDRDKRFRMRFELESRPQSADTDKEYFVDFDYSLDGLKRLSADLTQELDKFPERKIKR
jgi:hypothetical protein